MAHDLDLEVMLTLNESEDGLSELDKEMAEDDDSINEGEEMMDDMADDSLDDVLSEDTEGLEISEDACLAIGGGPTGESFLNEKADPKKKAANKEIRDASNQEMKYSDRYQFGVTFRNAKNIIENMLSRPMKTGDWSKVQKNLLKMVDSCKNVDELGYLQRDVNAGLRVLKAKAEKVPGDKDHIEGHIKWCKEVYVPAIKKKRAELKASKSESAELSEEKQSESELSKKPALADTDAPIDGGQKLEDTDELSEGLDYELYDPIVFSEDQVRVLKRDEGFIISESDFESVFHFYNESKDGYEIIDLIAESHGIKSEDIIIMMTEGAVAKPSVKVKKARSKAKSALENQISNLKAQLDNLPPNSAAATSKRNQLKKLRAKLTLSK